jgi:RNA polymerase sigma factor (sigma-70 family)
MVSRSWNGVLRFIRRTLSARPGAEAADGHLLDRYTVYREEEAFEELVRRHGAMVLGVCRRLLRDEHLAEDAFQATFLVLARKAGSIGQPATLAAWLYRVAYHIALRARKQAGRRRAREGSLHDAAREESADRKIEPELRRVLDEEVSRLPEKYRALIILCYWEGKTYEQAAALLGCPGGTVAGRLARARELLRRRLTRRGMALSAGALAAGFSQVPGSAAVPAALLLSTVRGALLFAARKGAVAGVSARAAAFAEEALRTMFAAKSPLLIALLV